jgi:hypothetical protein
LVTLRVPISQLLSSCSFPGMGYCRLVVGFNYQIAVAALKLPAGICSFLYQLILKQL